MGLLQLHGPSVWLNESSGQDRARKAAAKRNPRLQMEFTLPWTWPGAQSPAERPQPQPNGKQAVGVQGLASNLWRIPVGWELTLCSFI